MKFLNVSLLLLILSVASITAQRQSCGGRSWNPNCNQPLSWGQQGPGCQFRLMWWYDRSVNICRQMNYFGCGGNGNRWCSRVACERRCLRRSG